MPLPVFRAFLAFDVIYQRVHAWAESADVSGLAAAEVCSRYAASSPVYILAIRKVAPVTRLFLHNIEVDFF